jgi:hypothetical protein
MNGMVVAKIDGKAGGQPVVARRDAQAERSLPEFDARVGISEPPGRERGALEILDLEQLPGPCEGVGCSLPVETAECLAAFHQRLVGSHAPNATD